MRILQFQSTGGASGDMILGALVDLGVDVSWLKEQLASLNADAFDIEVRSHESHGIHGIQAHVRADDTHTGHGRHLSDITEIIEQSQLCDDVKTSSLHIFQRVAEAEAKVHGSTPDEIHFHEVGAMDSIVDIVGTCLALHQLEIDEVMVGPLPVGQGTTTIAHGTYPLPVPATVELLKGMHIVQTAEPYELVTPTGAALLSSWKSIDHLPAGSVLQEASYSFGHRVLDERPNVLRALLYEAAELQADTDACLVMECNIDDSTPELLGVLTERLLEEGALDVYAVPIQMKKQRPGVCITVLTCPELKSAMLDILFTESTTFGVREYMTHRTLLDRRMETVRTDYGNVAIKIGTWQGQDITHGPEIDDCIRLAKEHKVSVRKVYDEAARQHGSSPCGKREIRHPKSETDAE